MPFNAIFLISDPMQKWRLFANFVLYMLPFLAGALYLGTVFLKAQQDLRPRLFRRSRPAPACAAWPSCWRCIFRRPRTSSSCRWCCGSSAACCGSRRSAIAAASPGSRPSQWRRSPCTSRCRRCSTSRSSRCPTTRASSYARKFPDSQRVYERASPFGYLEVYSSSYLHFAPGLSDNAAFNLPKMPANAYLGMYIDGEGPSGIIRDLPAEETAYSASCRCSIPT